MFKKNFPIIILCVLGACLFAMANFKGFSKPPTIDLTAECQIKRNEYEQQILRKEFWNASFTMKRCGTELNNPEYLKIADAAEVKARISDINDKTKSLENRINQIEVLEKFFPVDAKEFSALKTSLIALKVKEEAAVAKAQADASRALKAKRKTEGVSIGMTKDEVLGSSWGKPESVNKTTNAYGVREQWVYGGRNYLYFKDGILESIQN
jgi:hypothetical protein